MTLYGYWRSSASYRIRIILNLKRMRWKNRPVMLNRDEHLAPGFRQLHPMPLVPLLDTGEGMLAQSPAIAEYLEERYPDPPLLPPDPLTRARIREMQSLVGCDIHPLQNLRVLRYLKQELDADETAVSAWCRRWIGDGFAAFEALAAERSGGGFACGDAPTLADVWLLPQVYNARRFEVDLEPFPVIRRIESHCGSLDAFRDAHPSRQPDAPAD